MRQRWLYHSGLWLSNIGFFLILDFAKRLDDLLNALDLPTLFVNFGVVAALSWAVILILTLLSFALERLGGLRLCHALAVFTFITINLWSLKVGLAGQLEAIRPEVRHVIAMIALGLALIMTGVITRNAKDPWPTWLRYARIVLSAWALGTLGLLGVFAAKSPTLPPSLEERPNIILLTIDSFAAKETTVYGYHKNTTPNLARFAADNITFERFHANFNVTGLALPSINGYLSRTPIGPTLAESLREAGYSQRAFLGAWTPETYSLKGFNFSSLSRQGMLTAPYTWMSHLFSEPQIRWLAGLRSEEFSYFNPYHRNYDDDMFWTEQHFPSAVSLKAGLEFLGQHQHNAFVWIHLWPPHFPYVAPPQTKGVFGPEPDLMRAWINVNYDESEDTYVAKLRNVYDRCVLEVDRQVGEFLEQLRAQKDWDRTIVIVAADHGESFERGYLGHSSWALMEAITHIPLIMHLPGQEGPLQVQTLAQQLDLAPTVLDLIGVTPPPSLPGESLVPYIKNPKALSEKYKVSVSLRASTGEGGQLAVYWKTYKLMFLSNDPKTFRLYDLFTDPEAKHDISAHHPKLVQEMMKRLEVESPGSKR